MGWNWGEIKTLLQGMHPQALKGKFVEKDSGSPTELALYARYTNLRIAGNPHKFKFALREYSLTLTGASEYNLETLIPDLEQIYQVTGNALPSGSMGYIPPHEYNVETGGVSFTVFGNLIRFRNQPTSGTLTIPYFTNYFVKSAVGVYQKDFTADGDLSIIPNGKSALLIEGIRGFIYQKEHSKPYALPIQRWDGAVVEIDPFEHQLQLAIQGDNDVHQKVYDFRFRN